MPVGAIILGAAQLGLGIWQMVKASKEQKEIEDKMGNPEVPNELYQNKQLVKGLYSDLNSDLNRENAMASDLNAGRRQVNAGAGLGASARVQADIAANADLGTARSEALSRYRDSYNDVVRMEMDANSAIGDSKMAVYEQQQQLTTRKLALNAQRQQAFAGLMQAGISNAVGAMESNQNRKLMEKIYGVGATGAAGGGVPGATGIAGAGGSPIPGALPAVKAAQTTGADPDYVHTDLERVNSIWSEYDRIQADGSGMGMEPADEGRLREAMNNGQYRKAERILKIYAPQYMKGENAPLSAENLWNNYGNYKEGALSDREDRKFNEAMFANDLTKAAKVLQRHSREPGTQDDIVIAPPPKKYVPPINKKSVGPPVDQTPPDISKKTRGKQVPIVTTPADDAKAEKLWEMYTQEKGGNMAEIDKRKFADALRKNELDKAADILNRY